MVYSFIKRLLEKGIGVKNMIRRVLILILFDMTLYAGATQSKVPWQELAIEAIKTKNRALMNQLLENEAKAVNSGVSILNHAIASGSKEEVRFVLEAMKQNSKGPKLEDYLQYKSDKPVLLKTISCPGSKWHVAWSPDGHYVSFGDIGGTIRIRHLIEGEEVGVIKYNDTALKLEWNSDGNALLAWGMDKHAIGSPEISASVKVWAKEQKRVIWQEDYDEWAWNSDRSVICVANRKGVHLWHIHERKIIGSLDLERFPKMAWSPNGKTLCIAVGHSLLLWDAELRKVTGTIEQGVKVYAVSWSPDGRLICVGKQNEACLWAVFESKVLCTMSTQGTVWRIRWSPHGSCICIGDQKWTQIWNYAENQQIGMIRHRDWALREWSFDGRLLYLKVHGSVHVWSVLKRKTVWSVDDIYNDMFCWSPDGSLVVQVGGEVLLIKWDPISGDILSNIKLNGYRMGISPDGTMICIRNLAGLLLQDIPEGTSRYILNCDVDVDKVAWSDDGSKIYAVTYDLAKVWDVGGTALDRAIKRVAEGGDIEIVRELLEECTNLEILCSRTLLIDISRIASRIKYVRPDTYKKLCEVISMIVNKPGAPL